MSKDFLSICITAHKEGFLIHKTILAIIASANFAKDELGLEYELIISADNADEETLQYLEAHKNQFGFKLYRNHFGDVGLSRNFLAEKASGSIVAFVDGDDLVSQNWFSEAAKVLRKNKNAVVHPEYCLSFGDVEKIVIWKQKNFDCSASTALKTCGENQWISTLAAKKEVFEAVKYPKSFANYGNEDWWFNTETLAHGYAHYVASDTLLFYRRKVKNSVFSSNAHSIQPRCSLFDVEKYGAEIAKIDFDALAKKSFKRKLYEKYKAVRASSLNVVITPFAKVVRGAAIRLGAMENKVSSLPKPILDAMREVAKVETALYPTPKLLKDAYIFESNGAINVGRAYFESMRDTKKGQDYDYVFIVPWLVSGGADLVLLNYVKAFRIVNPDIKIAIVTTLPSRNIWKSKLSSDVPLIDFGNHKKGLSDDEKELVFSRILAQLNAKNYHIINSEYAYRWAQKHEAFFTEGCRLNVSLFCHDVIANTNGEALYDFGDTFVMSIFDTIHMIYTDNRRVVERMIERCGVSDAKFKVQYQPASFEIIKPKASRIDKQRLRVLWAGRIAEQKCPQVLCDIARRLDADKFVIDVFGRLDGYSDKIFDGINMIYYKGAYNGFASINPQNYDVYLYTSAIDGVPNCLLEATSFGLPIVAPNVGGVGEVIKDGETGYLIENYNDIDTFVRALEKVRDNYADALNLAKNAQKLLQTQHSWETYEKTIRRDFADVLKKKD